MPVDVRATLTADVPPTMETLYAFLLILFRFEHIIQFSNLINGQIISLFTNTLVELSYLLHDVT